MREYGDAWLVTREASGIAMASDEKTNLTRHVYPELGDLPIDMVESSHIRSLFDALVAKGLGRATIGHIRALLHRLFKPAWVDRIIAENPVVRVELRR